MMKQLFCAILLAACTLLTAARLPRIIVAAPEAQKAARELKLHLEQITGQLHRIETEYGAKVPAIYVGSTAFAARNGLDFAQFAPEEWAIRSVNGSLIIGGGKLHGAEYGVYDFLENQMGCRWLTADSTYIPDRPQPELPQLDMRKQPAFISREIYMPPWDQGDPAKCSLFLRRNRGNQYDSPWREATRYPGHSFYHYVHPDKYFKSHPEYYSMDAAGKRFHGGIGGGAQLCLTNREVWRVTLENLRAHIALDRKELPREKWPVLYNIEQCDTTNFFCLCPECQAVTEREGSDSGLVLPYINFVAGAIAKEYPEIKIRTMAYVSSENPPRTNIRIAPNVLIRWCDLYTKSDCYRPLESAVNADRRRQLTSWAKRGALLSVWDYWNMGIDGYFSPPRIETMVDSIAPDIRFFQRNNVKLFMTESETKPHRNPQNFIDLQIWLGHQMLLDPARDEEKLIADFMTLHYRSAAPHMKEFLSKLRQAVRGEKKALYYIVNPVREYQTPTFIRECYTLLKSAEKSANADHAALLRVRKEMITPLAVLLLTELSANERASLLAEYKAIVEEQIANVCTPDRKENFLAEFKIDYGKLALNIPTPEQFKHLPPDRIKKFGWPNFSMYTKRDTIVADPDSIIGKAASTGDGKWKDISHEMRPQSGSLYPSWFGVYDSEKKNSLQLRINEIPQDERYHWYCVGKFEFGKQSFLWGFFWYLSANLRSVHQNADGLTDYNIWEVWISVKFTGPAYVANSKKPNSVFLDQVILVKP